MKFTLRPRHADSLSLSLPNDLCKLCDGSSASLNRRGQTGGSAKHAIGLLRHSFPYFSVLVPVGFSSAFECTLKFSSCDVSHCKFNDDRDVYNVECRFKLHLLPEHGSIY